MGVISLLGTGRRREEDREGGEGERRRERGRKRDKRNLFPNSNRTNNNSKPDTSDFAIF